MTGRNRRAAFLVLAGICVLGIAAAIAFGMRGGDDAAPADAAPGALRRAESQGSGAVVYRKVRKGGPVGAGRLAVSQLGDPPSRPALSPLRCDRSYFAAGTGICLARGRGFASGYEAKVFDKAFHRRAAIPVEGLPSRARVSPDGRYGAVTLFVTGHSYAEAGAFSTQTTLLDLRSGAKIADLESFVVARGQKQVTAIDRNFWGVTFARDSDRFYATMATGGKTYLVEGSVSRRTARVLHENVECPSLSPDGRRIAYKRRTGSSKTTWRLTVLDLRTMKETPLAETRSVDDQAEWLDDDTVLYGRDGAIWSVPADGTGVPKRFIAGADSPAVVRN